MSEPAREGRRWRFTWEALAHLPTVRLILFNTDVTPSIHCKNLRCDMIFEQFTLRVSWMEETDSQKVNIVLHVPVPKMFIDVGSPQDFKATEDYIEVKVVIIVPVDHPLVENIDSIIESGEQSAGQKKTVLEPSLCSPLSLDLKNLSTLEGIQFYCRSCCTKLTKEPFRYFVEMPSANWRDIADNWFGACCCSFGGKSEELVSAYANSYSCTRGTCLIDDTSIIVCKDDLLGYEFSEMHKRNTLDDLQMQKRNTLDDRTASAAGEKFLGANDRAGVTGKLSGTNKPSFECSVAAPSKSFLKRSQICCSNCEGPLDGTTSASNELSMKIDKLKLSEKGFSCGPLGNGFMISVSNFSNDIQWVEFHCQKCFSLLGSYPSHKGSAPSDDGIRLFKCSISTSIPVCSGDDLFRMHTLDRVFVAQLLENAADELSFRTVVRDFRTKSLMLQIVLVNSKAWCCTGDSLEDSLCNYEGTAEKIKFLPVVKVLFSGLSDLTDTDPREIKGWASNQINEVYMMECHIEELIKFLDSGKNMLPSSCSCLQGLLVSYLRR